MDDGDKLKYFLLTAGSLLVALSFTLVGKYAFEGEILYVVLGYSIFVLGYKSCWYGVYQDDGLDELRELLSDGFEEGFQVLKEKPLNYVLIAAGVYSAAYGTILFAQLVENPSVSTMLFAGVASFGGYIMAHEGVNEVPL
jgi:hypothetical protein